LFERAGLAWWSMSFPAVIIVGGVPVRLPAGGAYGAYRCATNGGGGVGPGNTGDVGTAIRCDLSLRKEIVWPGASLRSALEPQRLSRRRFPLISPCGVARGVRTDPHCVVRHLLPPLANIEG
jgi:hypothetical protein